MAYYDDIDRQFSMGCPKCGSVDIEYQMDGDWYCPDCMYDFFDPAYDLTDGDDPDVVDAILEQRTEDGYYDTYDDGSGNEISIENDIWDH